MLKKKNKEMSGKYSDWIGMSLETLTDMIAWFKNVVNAKFIWSSLVIYEIMF